MADYKAIKGWTIQTVSSDPSNLIAGGVWYNSTLGKVRGAKLAAAAWSSGGNLNSGRYRGGGGGCGTRDEALIFGGYSTATGSYLAQVEEYDGSSWTEGPHADYPSVTGDVGQCGTRSACLGVGGSSTSAVNEVYEGDGSSWTAGGNYPTAIIRVGVAGTQTAALGTCGDATPNTNLTAEYDGSSWTTGGNYPAPGSNVGNAGIQTAAIAQGGNSLQTEAATYDGSSWTAITDTNQPRAEHGWSTKGTTSDTMAFGMANTEKWDGSSWTEIADNSTPRTSGFGLGTTSKALYAGGNPGGVTTTEEFDHSISAVTFTST